MDGRGLRSTRCILEVVSGHIKALVRCGQPNGCCEPYIPELMGIKSLTPQ